MNVDWLVLADNRRGSLCRDEPSDPGTHKVRGGGWFVYKDIAAEGLRFKNLGDTGCRFGYSGVEP